MDQQHPDIQPQRSFEVTGDGYAFACPQASQCADDLIVLVGSGRLAGFLALAAVAHGQHQIGYQLLEDALTASAAKRPADAALDDVGQ